MLEGPAAEEALLSGRPPEDPETAEVRRRAGLELKFRGLNMQIKGRAILCNVSGTVQPGELLAVMGPSGSGKTTLLSALSGRQPVKSGTIKVNGVPLNKQLRRTICYVMQQDIFFPNLTLKDTLMYQAHLKLPSSMKLQEKEQIVTNLVEELDIKKCYNTIIGDEYLRGLSGGERKRANIACELLSDPALMLLDIAYYGASSKILEFFAALGLYCTPHYNPADFILDKVKESSEVRRRIVASANELRKTSLESPLDPEFTDDPDEKRPNGLTIKKEGQWKLSKYALKQGEYSVALEKDSSRKWPSSFWTQYSTLTSRNFKQQRAVILSWLNIVQTLTMAFVPGIIWWQLPKVEEQIYARSGLIYFILLYWAFTPIFHTLSTFPLERPVINKERLSGSYRLSAYYLAKMTSELPLTIIQPLISLTIAFWMGGLNGVIAYFVGLAMIMLGSITAQSIGLFASALFLRIDQSIIFATIFMLSTLLLGGFYIQRLPAWLTWARYLAFVIYPFHVMLSFEFSNNHTILCKEENSAYRHCNMVRNTTNASVYIPRDEILAYFEVTLPIWADVLILLLFLVAFRVACYLLLRFYRKP
ncbi:ABC transporter G family member 22-like isoform X2 [Carcharodon carcharias]|uniref:ABC transporter G family member 22-like isoform X2 n=1 Tax=Carcharodon carcharias TaxID=13397 RepID=UPI001B7DCEA1|nr:ABC transporter G family member 22-like isoform X2 [Carcharodon carcharias]